MCRKIAVISAVVVSCFLMAGCYSTRICAPGDTDVRLMSPGKPAAFKQHYRTWYAAWGLAPLNDGVVIKTIKENSLDEVRVEVKMTTVDWLISTFLGFVTIGSRTAVIEGNGK